MTIDLQINKDSEKLLFLKSTKPSIYTIFLELDDATLTKEKFKYCKIEFHLLSEEDAQVDFTLFKYHKTGRTIFSYMRDMVSYLTERWKPDGEVGHFHVCVSNSDSDSE